MDDQSRAEVFGSRQLLSLADPGLWVRGNSVQGFTVRRRRASSEGEVCLGLVGAPVSSVSASVLTKLAEFYLIQTEIHSKRKLIWSIRIGGKSELCGVCSEK